MPSAPSSIQTRQTLRKSWATSANYSTLPSRVLICLPESLCDEAFCVRCRYSSTGSSAVQAKPSEYDVALEKIAVDEPQSDKPETFEESVRRAARDELATAIGRFLGQLDTVGDALKVGQTVTALAFLVGQTEYKTKVELGPRAKGFARARFADFGRNH